MFSTRNVRTFPWMRIIVTIVSLQFVSSILMAGNPLKVEKTARGKEYYWIVRDSLEWDRADYSDFYEIYLTPIEGWLFEDCTQLFIDGKLQFEPTFFSSSEYVEDMWCDGPQIGVRGNDFKRLEVYFYPDMTRTDSVSYSLKGRTKFANNVYDLAGEIKVKRIYHVLDENIDFLNYYVIIADYDFNEKGGGNLRGILGAYAYVDDDNPNVLRLDDRFFDADGYQNRSFIGIWQSGKCPVIVERCVWGDYRLPFTFDFDIGDGEMRVNPKYASPEWEIYYYELEDCANGKEQMKYKNPWW